MNLRKGLVASIGLDKLRFNQIIQAIGDEFFSQFIYRFIKKDVTSTVKIIYFNVAVKKIQVIFKQRKCNSTSFNVTFFGWWLLPWQSVFLPDCWNSMLELWWRNAFDSDNIQDSCSCSSTKCRHM